MKMHICNRHKAVTIIDELSDFSVIFSTSFFIQHISTKPCRRRRLKRVVATTVSSHDDDNNIFTPFLNIILYISCIFTKNLHPQLNCHISNLRANSITIAAHLNKNCRDVAYPKCSPFTKMAKEF